MNNILVTTLGASWQIAPELLGFTNPERYDFFKDNSAVDELRRGYNIESVDETWIISTENQKDIQKLQGWSEKWKLNIKIVICKGINDFSNQQEIEKMRSLIYRVVLKASDTRHQGGKLYLSLSGGRKTMSADMQEAGNLFGFDAMLHVIETKTMGEIRNDTLLGEAGKYANDFMPIIINGKTDPGFIVSTGDNPIASVNFPFDFSKEILTVYDEDNSLAKEVQKRKNQSSQLYSNFYDNIVSKSNARDIFRKLYFLHPELLRKLKEFKIGGHGNEKRDMNILRALPKADLHSHFGGVLSPEEIIQTAIAENVSIQKDKEWQSRAQKAVDTQNIDELQRIKKELFEIKQSDFKLFYEKLIVFFSAFSNNASLFEKLIFGEQSYPIGIEAYQKLGDFQGSSLLQTGNTITKAAELYAKKLIQDNVRYVEIRCSPYKYTEMGLQEEDVVNLIMDVFDNTEKIEYRLLCIIGRDAKHAEIKNSIKNSIKKIENLRKTNERFLKKFAGIDLAGTEGACKPKDIRDDFMPFLEKCIPITIHAGETEAVSNIWEAVYHLSADRIGHGLTLLNNHDLMSRFIDKNIGVELCPSSNDQIVGYEKSENEYPLKKYMEKGLKVTINTDNIGISRTSSSKEYYKAAQLCGGFSLWDCLVLIRNSLSVAFTDRESRIKLLRSFEDEIYDWCLQNETMLY